jgi:integrase
VTGPVLVRAADAAPVRRHANRQEYVAWLREVFGERPAVQARTRHYDRFVERWPDLETWFAAPLLSRLSLDQQDRFGQARVVGTTREAGPYLCYLSLVHGVAMDADYLLSRSFPNLLEARVGPALGFDLDLFEAHHQRLCQLGYTRANAQRVLTWTLTRLCLRRGDPEFRALTSHDIHDFGQAVCRFCAHADAGTVLAIGADRASRDKPAMQLAASFQQASIAKLHTLHVLLFNTGQIGDAPRPGLGRRGDFRDRLTPPGTSGAIAAPVERWLRVRLEANLARPALVRPCWEAVGRLLAWLGAEHPEIANLNQLTRDHVEQYLQHLGACTARYTGRLLAKRTRRRLISRLAAFFRETSQWGWDDVPSRPLLSRSDLPKLPESLPRFLPRHELDRLMAAVETLPNRYQRTALLLLRWSGARRGEVARITLDCLDTYADNYPRLRIPVGKGYTDRIVPLHPQAAAALRELIEITRAKNIAPWYDPWAERPVRLVFTRYGKPMGTGYLFETPLQTTCRKVGLVDEQGRPTVTAHRFRHTVGTQLAEGGARIQTIMSVLGHRSAQMSAYYSRISDPVMKEQYEKVIAGGGQIAGPAAEALLTNQLDEETVDWLKTNFFKTELELGHCLRLPQEGPCECDLYLRCSKFFTTSEYAPRLRARLIREQQLIQDATERGWPREVERHTAIAARICELLAELGEPIEGPMDECR